MEFGIVNAFPGFSKTSNGFDMKIKSFLAGVILLLASYAYASDETSRTEMARLFAEAGVEGTFVLYDVPGERMMEHNSSRAQTRFVPASTFKIANSLIGLSAHAVASVDQILPYGGQPQPYKIWERDMSLRDAIAISNVPIYQELARRIGLEQMRQGLSVLEYGNQNPGEIVDRFWLDGPLEISAVEQVRFLARLAQGQLPLAPEIQSSVRDILKIDEGSDWKLYAKTGWQNAPDAGIGWWVGWVQKGQDTFAFAINIDIKQASDADKRIALGKECLKIFGLLGE